MWFWSIHAEAILTMLDDGLKVDPRRRTSQTLAFLKCRYGALGES